MTPPSRIGAVSVPPPSLHAPGCNTVEALNIPIPFDRLALLGTGALVTVLAIVGLGLLFLRPSTGVEEVRTT